MPTLPFSDSLLFKCRLTCLIFFFATFIYSIYLDGKDKKYPFELTRHHHLFTCILILLSCIKSRFDLIKEILYSVNLPIGIIVCVVFWTMMFNPTMNLGPYFVSVVAHALIPLYGVFELITNTQKVHKHAHFFAFFISLLYLCWTGIYYLIYSSHVYDGMQNYPFCYLFFIGGPVACFCLTWLNLFAHKIRNDYNKSSL